MPIIYTKPQDVKSPKKHVSGVDINSVYDGGEFSVSIAKLKWDGIDRIGIRWNVSHAERLKPDKISGRTKCIGNPSSHAKPSWFILPPGILDENSDLFREIKERLFGNHSEV